MNIQTRIKKIEQILKTDTKYHKFIQLIQSKPHSNIYAVSEQYKGKYKHYNTDNLEDFYKQNTGDTTHILQIVCCTCHAPQCIVLFSVLFKQVCCLALTLAVFSYNIIV